MSVKSLRLENISLSFGKNEIFANMNYEFTPGIYAFSGPSGVGKSTLMRMIAGLESRYSGNIILTKCDDFVNPFGCYHSYNITKPSPEVHMVHQHYKSFPWLSCFNNVLMVHKGHKAKVTQEDRKDAFAILERLGIREHADKYPTQVSGGQDQRLSLASAFVNRWSSVVLYDEPTSALDDLNDMLVVDLIREHQARYNTIEIIITHEQHVIDGLNPTIIEFTPEFRINPSIPTPSDEHKEASEDEK